MNNFKKDEEIVLQEEATGAETVVVLNDKKAVNKAFRVKENEALREANKKVFEMSDGTIQAIFFPEPVHFYDKKKKSFVEVDNSVEDEEDGKHIRNKKNKFVARFNKETNSDELFVIENEGYAIKISTAEHPKRKTKKKQPKVHKSESESVDRIAFNDVESSTNFEYTVHSDRVKEDIVIKSKKASYKYGFVIEHIGLSLGVSENANELTFSNGKKEIFSIPAPFMYDANDVLSTDVMYEIEAVEEGKSKLTVIADEAWINDENRAFPVVIDPQIVISGTTNTSTFSLVGTTMVSSASHLIGNTSVNGAINRMFMKLNVPSIAGNPRIQKVELTLNQSYGYIPSSEVHRLGIYEVVDAVSAGECQCPSFDDVPIDYARAKNGSASYTFDITKALDDYYNGVIASPTVMVKMIDETVDSTHYVKMYGSSNSTKGPIITVTYDNSYAVPSSSIHTHEIGKFGTASVDLITGALNIESEDFVWQGIRKPVSIKHYYNNALRNHKYTENPSMRLNVADFSGMSLGCGWRLNYMQSMVAGTFMINGESITGYIYTDETGNELFFKAKDETNSVYVEIDGNGYEYSVSERKLNIGNEYYLFDTAGRLVCITDGKVPETKIDITYDTAGKITKITDGVGREFVFGYTTNSTYGNYLTSITAPDGTVVKYGYSSGKLTSVTYPNGQKASITNSTYGGITSVILKDENSVNLYKTTYSYTGKYGTSNYCVSSVYEYGYTGSAWTLGKQVSYSSSRSAKKTTVQIYATGETTKKVVYTFDEEGNIIGNYEVGSNGNVELDGVGEGIDPMFSEEGIKSNSVNLLFNHNFERMTDGVPSNWTSTGATDITFAQNSEFPRFGKYSLLMSATNSATKGKGIYQTVSLPTGKYAFSVYVKSNKAEDAGVYIRVSDSSNNVIAASELKNYYDRHFTRLVVPFEITTATDVKCEILIDGNYSAYIDGAQLEKGEFANTYNMLENGGFEASVSCWSSGMTDGVLSTMNDKFNMSNSLQIIGSLDKLRYAKQSVIVARAKGDRENLTLSGWAKAPCIVRKTREGEENPIFRLKGVIRYEYCKDCAIEDEEFYADFSPFTEDWQKATVEIAKSKKETVSEIIVYCEYGFAPGLAYFDDIQLVRNTVESNYEFVSESVVDDDEETASTDVSEVIPFEEVKDAFGNALTETTYIDGEFGTIYKSMGYTEDGNELIEKTDQRNNKTIYDIDPITSDVCSITDKCKNKTEYEYDAVGRVTKVKQKIGNTEDAPTMANVSYEYDTFDNMTKIVRGDGMGYLFGYDKLHNHDSIQIEGKAEKLVAYEYGNSGDKIKKLIYANGDYVSIIYNSVGLVVSEKWYDSDNSLKFDYRYVYDENGNVVRSIDKKSLKEYNYYYEEGEIVRSSESDVQLDGDIVTAKFLVNTIFYNYIDGKLVKKAIVPASGQEIVYRYEYTEADEIIVKCVVDGKQVLSHSKSDGFGRRVFDELQLGKGFVSRQFAYHVGEVTEAHENNDKLKSTPTTNLVSQILLSDGRTLSYEYDAEERITSVTEKLGEKVTVKKYTYDALGQLLKEEKNDVIINEMKYDNYGNIVEKNGVKYTYDSVWKDLLIRINSKTYNNYYCENCENNGQTISYDSQGNPTNYFGHILTWEKGRQLKSFDNNTYTYNANGIRTSKTVNGVTHNYILDGAKILKEQWGENTLIPIYDNEDSICGIIYNGTSYYFLKNLQGDIISIVNTDGEVVVKYEYDAWGKVLSIANNDSVDISFDSTHIGVINPFRYRGYYYDNEVQLYYLQSRYYNADLGRFISSDVIIDERGILGKNLFSYCWNNPINMSDETGYYTGTLVLSSSIISALSNALPGIIASISASMASIKAAIATSWFIPVCIAAAAIAIIGIIYVVNRMIALATTAKEVRSRVISKVKSGGLDKRLLGDYSVYVIVRKGTTDVVYVGMTKNYKAREDKHTGSKGKFPKSKYTMMPIATNLTKEKARALEQTIITAYGLDTLCNLINSISPKKWKEFQQEFKQMQTLIQSFIDPE